METAEFLRHIPCDSCGSSDGAALYQDDHTFCFVCLKHTNGANSTQPRETRKMTSNVTFLEGESKALTKRGITEETCAKWRYQVADHNGSKVQVANYYVDNTLVGQKVRTADKDFRIIGSLKEAAMARRRQESNHHRGRDRRAHSEPVARQQVAGSVSPRRRRFGPQGHPSLA